MLVSSPSLVQTGCSPDWILDKDVENSVGATGLTEVLAGVEAPGGCSTVVAVGMAAVEHAAIANTATVENVVSNLGHIDHKTSE